MRRENLTYCSPAVFLIQVASSGMSTRLRAWACAIACVLLAGCAQSPPPLPSGATGIYHLGTGDTVRIIVYNQQSLSNDFIVGDDGTISVPMLGAVPARGKTVQELENDLYNK